MVRIRCFRTAMDRAVPGATTSTGGGWSRSRQIGPDVLLRPREGQRLPFHQGARLPPRRRGWRPPTWSPNRQPPSGCGAESTKREYRIWSRQGLSSRFMGRVLRDRCRPGNGWARAPGARPGTAKPIRVGRRCSKVAHREGRRHHGREERRPVEEVPRSWSGDASMSRSPHAAARRGLEVRQAPQGGLDPADGGIFQSFPATRTEQPEGQKCPPQNQLYKRQARRNRRLWGEALWAKRHHGRKEPTTSPHRPRLLLAHGVSSSSLP